MAFSQQQLTDFSVIPSKQSYFPPAIVALSHICARSGQERSTFMDPETTRLNQNQLFVDLSMCVERVIQFFWAAKDSIVHIYPRFGDLQGRCLAATN